MGIKKFNDFVKQISKPLKKKITFKTIIIDGNNLLVTYLSKSYYSIRMKNYDLPTQIKYIISNTIGCINNFINTLKKYKDVEIFIVFDPVKTANYNLYCESETNENDETNEQLENDDLNQNETNEQLETDDLKQNETNDLKQDNKPIIKTFDLKKETQERRRKNMNNNKAESIIEQIKFENDDLTFTEENKVLINCVQQMFYFSNQTNLIKLTTLIKNILSSNPSLTCIQSISEADMTIKYFASVSRKPCLVMSKDTDYFVLLADIKYVFKSEFNTSDVYYPLNMWKKINLDPLNISDLKKIYTLSTLSGNDYTNDKFLITPSKETFEKLLQCEIKYSSFRASTKIYKYLKSNDISNFETLLNYILSDSTFSKSIEVYLSWDINHEFEIMKKLNDDEINIILQKYINDVILSTFNELYSFEFIDLLNDSYLDSFTKVKQYIFIDSISEILNYEQLEYDDKILIDDE